MQLDIAEWDGVWVDFSNAIRTGERVNGVWHLHVMREGRYTFTLRRWPEELGLPMRATAPQGPWPYAAGKALPIAKVRIQIQGQTALADVAEDANAVRITLTLKAGRTELKTAFVDAQGELLCGAYYTDVQEEEVIRKIEPLSVRGVNYFPRNTPWGKMWTQTPPEVWEQDMAAAAKLGVNTVRTFLIFSPDDVKNGLATADGTPTPAYREKLERLLAAGWKHGIHFVLCFEFSEHIFNQPDGVQRWQRAMRSIVVPLRDDGRVLMWDLMNEPESDHKWTERTKTYLKGARVFLKEIDPKHFTTIGITYRTDRLQEIGLPDVLQYHEYGVGRKFTVQSGIERTRSGINHQGLNQTERPLIIGEFGMCTARDAQHGASPELTAKLNNAPGTEAEQAQVYSAVLEAVKQERIGGAIAWCLYDYPIKNPNESHFGLIRADGTLKPAAKVLRDAFNAWGK